MSSLDSALLVMYLLSTCHACPTNIIQATYSCMSPITTLNKPYSELNNPCLNGGKEETITCISNLFHACKYDRYKNEYKLLHKLINLDDTIEAFNDWCSQTDLYKQSSRCIYRHKSDIDRCSQAAVGRYTGHSKVSATDQNIQKLCRIMQVLTQCTVKPIRRYCNTHLADSYNKFMNGISPPTCRHVGTSTASNHYLHSHLHMNCLKLISLCIYIIYFTSFSLQL